MPQTSLGWTAGARAVARPDNAEMHPGKLRQLTSQLANSIATVLYFNFCRELS